MAADYVVGLINLILICFCTHGLYQLTQICPTFLCVFYTGSWFLTSGGGAFLGCLALIFSCIDADPYKERSFRTLQYHYLLLWLSCTVGYTGVVGSAWMMYYSSTAAHLHMILAIFPLVAWLQRQGQAIIYTTQIVAVISVLSHLYISFLAGDKWSLCCGGTMLLNLVFVSIPTRYSVLGLSAREGYIVASCVMCFCLIRGVGNMEERGRQHVESLVPW